MSSPTLRARRAAYGLALAVAVFLLVRLLQGARLDEPWAGQRLPWDLQVLRHTAGGAETLGILALVLGMAVVALGMRRLLAGGEAPVSAGEVLFFAASTADAVDGTVLHLLDPESAARGAALLVPARALVLAAAFPLMFLHLRRPGLCLLPAAVVLTLLGAALFHARVPAVPYQPPWRSGRAVDLVEAACPLYDLAEYRNGTVESRRSARQAYLGILKELVSMGRPGAEAVLYDRGGNVGWASHFLPEFGDDCQPVFLAALRSRFATARRGALSALEHRADRTEVARALVPLLSDPEPGVRQETARILGHVGHDREKHPPPARVEEAVVPLRRLLWDVDADTRETAVAALRYQAPRAAVADLAKLLRFEKNSKVCGEAWQTLALAATPDAIRAIAETYRREKGGWGNLHLDVQVPALPEPAVSVLIDLLETVHAENAWSVLQAVEFSPGMRLPRRAMDWLLAVACDADPKRRQTALRVVSHLDDPAAVEMCRAAMATGDAPWVVEGLRRCD
ncbi:MAG TPA: HEAT repeat domain-containing protein, partial [Planctomycetota bacterium]|nr:HEAT repeat domain-containing protein [Planctomycetota bacterium]